MGPGSSQHRRWEFSFILREGDGAQLDFLQPASGQLGCAHVCTFSSLDKTFETPLSNGVRPGKQDQKYMKRKGKKERYQKNLIS